MTKKTAEDFLPRGVGKPTLYNERYCEEVLEYFTVEPYREVTRVNKKTGNEYTELVANDLRTVIGFANKIGVSDRTVQNWAKAHPAFGDALERAKQKAEEHLVVCTLHNLYNPQFAQFVAKNYTKMRDIKDLNIHDETGKRKTHKELLEEIELLDQQIAELEAQL